MPNGQMAPSSSNGAAPSGSHQNGSGAHGAAAEAGTSSAGSNQRRQQGVSCDACKFRKVKCDRRAKVEKRLAELVSAGGPSTLTAAEDRDVSCSVCMAHGLRCTFTQAEPKKRRGRRLVAIQAQQKQEASVAPSADAAAAGVDANGRQPRARHVSSYPSPSSTPSTALGLFSVPGLTRSLLDACVVAYFKYCVPVVAVLHADTFSARYARYFAEYAGQPHVPASHVDPALASLPPLTELQILAVGCAGAGLLQPPITGANPRAKFKLQEALAQRCHSILSSVSWAQRLKEEGTDLFEAVYILVDPTAPSVTDDLEHAHKQGVMRPPSDPLHVQPTSHEAVVRLALGLSLHRRPKAEPGAAPNGPRWRTASGELIDDREMFRRVRSWWSCFCQDSFRSCGAHRTPLISEDQYDQDLPRWRDRGEGAFSTTFGMQAASHDTFFSPQGRGLTSGPGSEGDPYPASAGPQYPHFSRFDAVWLEALLRLCFITRTVGARTVSTRAQGRGVLLSDLEHAMSAYGLWMAQLPQEITWEVQMADLRPDQPLHNIAFRNGLKASWLEILAKGQVLSLWAAVKDYGLRTETDVLDAAGALASRLTLNDSPLHERHTSGTSPAHAGTPGSLHPDGPAPHVLPDAEREVRARLQGLTTDCFFRMAHLCSNAAAFGFMRASRQVMRDVTCSYAMWGCSLASDILKGVAAPRLGAQVHYDQVIEAIASLVEAVASVDSVRDTHIMVRGLRDILHKFPGGLESGKRMRGETASPPSDKTSPPQAALHHLSAAAVAQRGRSESMPWHPPQGFGSVCGPEGDMSQPASLPSRQANDEIAALSSNADALFDMGHGGQTAPELLDAQWLEQLTAGNAPPVEHPAARMMHGGGGSVPGGHVEPHWNGPAVMQPPRASEMLGDAQAWASQAWGGQDGVAQAQEPQGSYEWLWGVAPS